MGKFCGKLKVGASTGGGTVGSQTVRGNQVVSSFEVPVAVDYELDIGDTHFNKIRCCEQAMAPFVAENHGNDVCIYTFKQIPKTTIMLAIVSNDGPSYRMSSGRLYLTIFAQLLVVLFVAVIVFFIPYLGLILAPVTLFFGGKYIYELWTSFGQMKKDGAAANG